MGCFLFPSKEKKVEQGTTQSISFQSNTTSGTKSGSEIHSQNISTTSTESLVRPSYPSFSRRANDLRGFTYAELKSATKNFSRSAVLGEGGFGCVYRGIIKNSDEKKIDVAVKKLGGRGMQGHKEWVTEVNVLGVVSHPNLVKLIGYCAEDDERGIQRLLVYEYMPNGSVDDHLSVRSKTILPWRMRLQIALHAARGLTHLHEDMGFQIIFRDFKSSNILLDENWNAKLSDFGLARLGPSDGRSHVSTAVVGTMGYAAPEYVQTGRLTSKNDVWSYGVFLFELITGRRPLDRSRPKSEQKLLEWVKPYLTDGKKFKLIIDPRLEGNYSIKSAQKLANLGNQCLARSPKLRPKMSEVLEIVNQIVESEESGSPQKPYKNLKDARFQPTNMNSDSSKEESRWPFRTWITKLSKPR